jgi:hypothetical protein
VARRRRLRETRCSRRSTRRHRGRSTGESNDERDVGPSLNAPLLTHPEAQASLRKLPTWHVTIVPPVNEGEGPRLAPSEQLIEAVRPYARQR